MRHKGIAEGPTTVRLNAIQASAVSNANMGLKTFVIVSAKYFNYITSRTTRNIGVENTINDLLIIKANSSDIVEDNGEMQKYCTGKGAPSEYRVIFEYLYGLIDKLIGSGFIGRTKWNVIDVDKLLIIILDNYDNDSIIEICNAIPPVNVQDCV